MEENFFVGKNIPRVDGREKAIGKAIYSTDIQLPGILTGRIKRSPYPFAKVLSINTEKAQRLIGVKAVITARSVTQFPCGPMIADELPLADSYVRYIGDEVAAVAAIDADIAEEAPRTLFMRDGQIAEERKL